MILTAQGLEIVTVDKIIPSTAEQMLASFAFYPYRRWKGFGPGVPQELLRWDLVNGFSSQTRLCLLAMEDARPVGLARVDDSPWESGQLGERMASLRHLIVSGSGRRRRDIAEALLLAAAERLRGDINCLTHRIDDEDYDTIAGLESQGFQLVDTQISFIRGPAFRSYLKRRFRRSCVVRPCRPEDWTAVQEIARETRFGGRYYNDPRFSRERVDALYEEWARLAYRRIFANEMMVAVRHGRVGGYLSYQFQRWMYEAARVRLMGRGLLAVGRAFKGSALELIRGSSLRDHGADFLQCDIHLNNYEFGTLLGRGLRMDVAHIHHVFHKWFP